MTQHLSLRRRLRLRTAVLSQEGLAKTQRTVDEVEAKSSAIAEEVAVHLAIVPIEDTARLSITFVGRCVAAEGAMHADRWRAPQIPFALINFGRSEEHTSELQS